MGSPGLNSVLVIVASPSTYDLIHPFLSRSDLRVTKTSSGPEGLRICRTEPADLVVAQHPLSGFSRRDFFDDYYRPEPDLKAPPLLVLTRENRLDEIRVFIENRQARACCMDTAEDENFHQALYELVGVSARCNGRLLVTAEVELGESSIERVFQTANISRSGVLLKSRRLLELGEIVPFTVQIPAAVSAIRAIGEVVRHADPEIEGIHGIGLRIIDFEGQGQSRLDRYVESRLAGGGSG